MTAPEHVGRGVGVALCKGETGLKDRFGDAIVRSHGARRKPRLAMTAAA